MDKKESSESQMDTEQGKTNDDDEKQTVSALDSTHYRGQIDAWSYIKINDFNGQTIGFDDYGTSFGQMCKKLEGEDGKFHEAMLIRSLKRQCPYPIRKIKDAFLEFVDTIGEDKFKECLDKWWYYGGQDEEEKKEDIPENATPYASQGISETT